MRASCTGRPGIGASSASRARGATLLELLVALALIATAAGLAARGVPALTRGQAQATGEWRDLIEREDARNGFVRDLRFIDLPLAGGMPQAPPLAGDAARVGGQRQGAGDRTVGWFAWRLESGGLERLYWSDAAQALGGAAPEGRARLIEGVAQLELRYLDADQQWHAQWPLLPAARTAAGHGASTAGPHDPAPVQAAGAVALADDGASSAGSANRLSGDSAETARLPRAVELRLVLANGQEVHWRVRPGLP